MLPSCESSYGWSNHDRDGWPDRFYYTYYTSIGHRDEAIKYLESLLFACILLVSLLANILIIASILRRKDMQAVTKCFVINLAVADLVFALGIPAIVTARVSSTWTLGESTCKLLTYSQFVCGSVLLWTLAVISMDRVQCLAKAPYRSGFTKKTAIALVIGSWIVALLVFLPVPILFREQEVKHIDSRFSDDDSDDHTICTLVFPPGASFNNSLTFTVVIVLISCVIPMGILLFNFVRIFKKLAKIQRKLEEKTGHVQQFSKFRFSLNDIVNRISQEVKIVESPISQSMTISSPRETKSHRSSISSLNRLKKHRRAVRILFCNTFAVIAMWLPITVVMFLIYVDGHRANSDYFLSNQYFVWSVVVALMNTIVNPVIYGFLTEHDGNDFSLKSWLKSRCFPGDANEGDSDQNNSSSQNSKNLTIKNKYAENQISLESHAR